MLDTPAMNVLEKIQREGLSGGVPELRAGSTVRVHTKIKEGDKERVQIFEGIILRTKGHGREASFTVRKVSYGVGVERIFPIHSPMIHRIEVVSCGKVRRARIYYLRDLSGKKARIEGVEAEESKIIESDSPSAHPSVSQDAHAKEKVTAKKVVPEGAHP